MPTRASGSSWATTEHVPTRRPSSSSSSTPPSWDSRLSICPAGRSRALTGGAAPRQPRPLSDFEAERRRLAQRLRAVAGIEGRPSHVDVLCGRLYTGPLFVKYNAVLRGASADAPPYLRRRLHELCLGNQYTTTLHALNSTLLVLSQLTVVRRVYRVVSGAALPDALRVPDELGCVGGVELGFLSTTENRELALETAARDGGVLLELSMSPPLMDGL